jgi:hypothetical protein
MPLMGPDDCRPPILAVGSGRNKNGRWRRPTSRHSPKEEPVKYRTLLLAAVLVVKISVSIGSLGGMLG